MCLGIDALQDASQGLLMRVGEAVSAKYRGAWCEGTIKRVEKAILVKVRLCTSVCARVPLHGKHTRG